MKIIRFVRAQIIRRRAVSARRRLLRGIPPVADDIRREQWSESLADPTAFYIRCYRYFHTGLPDALRRHREYFTQERRGFGEDAFHVLWFLVFRELRPRNFLEIGVYRGQTLSLAGALQQLFDCKGEIVGISPFTPAGDSVSKYRQDVDYQQDTLNNFAHFSLAKPTLLKAFSTDQAAKELIASRSWDCIYIDGNHDYDIALADWNLCAEHVRPGGLIVLDDSGLSTSYQPPLFATGGHPGPSRVATEIDQKNFREVLQVGHNRVFQKIG